MCLCQVFVGTFFVFRNSVEKFCVSWAFPLIECVAVWALKPPVPHTDVLKTHSSQSFSTELLEYKGTGSEHLSQTNPSKLSFSLSYNRIPKYLSGCGCCCLFPSHHSPLSLYAKIKTKKRREAISATQISRFPSFSFLFYSLKSFFQVFNNIIYILCSD